MTRSPIQSPAGARTLHPELGPGPTVLDGLTPPAALINFVQDLARLGFQLVRGCFDVVRAGSGLMVSAVPDLWARIGCVRTDSSVGSDSASSFPFVWRLCLHPGRRRAPDSTPDDVFLICWAVNVGPAVFMWNFSCFDRILSAVPFVRQFDWR